MALDRMKKIVTILTYSTLSIGYVAFGFLIFNIHSSKTISDFVFLGVYLFVTLYLLRKENRQDIKKSIDLTIDKVIIRTLKDLLADSRSKEFWIIQTITLGKILLIFEGFLFWWKIVPVLVLILSDSKDYLAFMYQLGVFLFLIVVIVLFVEVLLNQNFSILFKSIYRMMCLFACYVQISVLLPEIKRKPMFINEVLDKNQYWYLFLMITTVVIAFSHIVIRKRIERSIELGEKQSGINSKFAATIPNFKKFEGLLIRKSVNVNYQSRNNFSESFIPLISCEIKARIRYTPIILTLGVSHEKIYSLEMVSMGYLSGSRDKVEKDS